MRTIHREALPCTGSAAMDQGAHCVIIPGDDAIYKVTSVFLIKFEPALF